MDAGLSVGGCRVGMRPGWGMTVHMRGDGPPRSTDEGCGRVNY